MPNFNNMTKAEIIKLLELEQREKETLLDEKKKRTEAIEFDLDFSESDDERDKRSESQMRKDFIKRMTNGRWTSEDKYQEWIKSQKNNMRMI